MQAILSNVMVEADKAREKSAGGVILPQGSADKVNSGTVVSVGNKVEVVKSGDRVIYNKYNAISVSVGGKEFLVLEEKDILVVL